MRKACVAIISLVPSLTSSSGNSSLTPDMKHLAYATAVAVERASHSSKSTGVVKPTISKGDFARCAPDHRNHPFHVGQDALKVRLRTHEACEARRFRNH